MENFVFQNCTKIIFGKDTEKNVGNEVVNYGRNVLLHYGGGSIKKFGLYDTIIKSLKESGVNITELGGVQANPRLKMVKEGIRLCRENNIDFILAVGGGSVIDSAKAISIGVSYDGDVWDFYTGKAVINEALPVGVVLTIPAAGSESSPASVINKEEGNLKRDCGSNLIRPKFAILNPELTYTLPDYQTICGAADIMAHGLERYFTQTKDVGFTDRLLEAVLKTMIQTVPLVLESPENYDLRAEIMWAGTVVHNDLLGTGRIEDWASHMIEHELSGLYDVAHGAGLAVVFPAWMKYVYKENLQRFVQYAVRVWGVENDFQNPERTALEGIKRTKDFFSSIGLPTTLAELEIPDDKLEEMAEKCTANGPVGNFKSLFKEDVLNIYKLAR